MTESAKNYLLRQFAQRVKEDQRTMEFIQQQYGEAGIELDTRAREYQEQHSAENLTYEECVYRVSAQNPTLTVRFNEETAEKAAKRI